MIKVKVHNPTGGRNEPTFRPLFFVKDLLQDYSIDLTTSDDFDYLFVGMNEFINKRVPLQESIDKGLEFLSTVSGPHFIFDGSDSHSLMGSYEVFTQSNATYLFKQQLHRDRSKYNTSVAFNKWFFGPGSDLDLSYDIPQEVWNNIKLTGWNFLSHVPSHREFIGMNPNKSIDVCAVFGSGEDGKQTFDHGARNDMYYRGHRQDIHKVLKKLSSKYNIVVGRQPWQEYMNTLYNSKICISPFGMGEIRQGDGEAMQVGTLIMKEDMSMYDFGANIWEENKTYIPFSYDCSNLEEQLDEVLSNYSNYIEVVQNFRKRYLEEYDPHKLCLHWYNIFKDLPGVQTVTN